MLSTRMNKTGSNLNVRLLVNNLITPFINSRDPWHVKKIHSKSLKIRTMRIRFSNTLWKLTIYYFVVAS